MSNYKGPTEGGSGGKRGHSAMEHWTDTKELKDSSRVHRRQDDRKHSREGIDKDTRNLLESYWFPLERALGIGVTAYSLSEASRMAERCLEHFFDGDELGEPTIGVCVEDLDQGHVVPNMGPINFKGVWFPKCNI